MRARLAQDRLFYYSQYCPCNLHMAATCNVTGHFQAFQALSRSHKGESTLVNMLNVSEMTWKCHAPCALFIQKRNCFLLVMEVLEL